MLDEVGRLKIFGHGVVFYVFVADDVAQIIICPDQGEVYFPLWLFFMDEIKYFAVYDRYYMLQIFITTFSAGIPLTPEGGTIATQTSACPSTIVSPSGVRGIADGMKNIALIFVRNLCSKFLSQFHISLVADCAC